MSVTVGFSQATTSLIAPAAGATKPDGTPVAGGGTEAGGVASLFAALMAMLTPGAQPSPEAESATTGTTVAPTPIVGTPPVDFAAAETTASAAPALPDLMPLQQSPEGKALLKDLTDALKAAKAALDEGKPLDPALAKKLKTAVDTVAAWFAGQPQLQSPAVASTSLGELAAASDILPVAPSNDLPPAPGSDVGDDAPDAQPPETVAAAPAPVSDKEVPAATPPVATTVQARPVPPALAGFAKALGDFATALESTEPTLAASLRALADRASVGDISDEALVQLGLNRTAAARSPELENLVSAVSTPVAQRSPDAPRSPIAAAILGLPEVLKETKPGAQKPDVPKSGDAPPAASAKADTPSAPETTGDAEQTVDTPDAELTVKLEPKATRHDAAAPADDNPTTPPAHASSKAAETPPAAPADNSAQLAQAAATTAATATRAIHAAYAAPVQQINVPQVAFEVVRQFEAGNTRFQIRLDPADLGRIDVSLDLDKHGTVNARMFVERPETLDLMMRDQRALQQALQQAGLDTGKTNLEFSLRQNPFAGGGDMGQNGGDGGERGFGPFGTPAADEAADLPAQTLYRGSASQSGVNLFV